MKNKFFLLIISMLTILLPVSISAEGATEISTEASSGYTHVPVFDSAMRYEMLFLLVIVVLCYVQTLLTNRQNKFSGLILPCLSLIGMTSATFIYTLKADAFSLIGFIVTLTFLNIPTLVLFLIYHFGRKKYEKESRPPAEPAACTNPIRV